MAGAVHELDSRALLGLVDHRLPLGVLGLDRSGRVFAANHAAGSILADHDGLSIVHGRLVASCPRESAALRKLVEGACRGRGHTAAGGMLHVSRSSPHLPLALLVTPVRLSSGVPDVAATVFVCDPERPAQTWEVMLRRHYGLTRTEAAIALLLLEGVRVEEMAARRRTTTNTARTHLKRIFDKTGTRCQADLVRRLLSGEPGGSGGREAGTRRIRGVA